MAEIRSPNENKEKVEKGASTMLAKGLGEKPSLSGPFETPVG